VIGNGNGTIDESALSLPEDDLQGLFDAAAQYGLAMNCVRRAIQYRAGSRSAAHYLAHYLARGQVHATLAVASASMAKSLPAPRPRPQF